MPTFNWLKNAFADGYSSGDIASPLPNWRRWHEERRIGGSYRQVLAKGILPYVRQNAVVLEIGPGRGSWTRALLKRAYERVRSTLWIFTMWLSGFSRKSTMEG
jgi:hypothetical protein